MATINCKLNWQWITAACLLAQIKSSILIPSNVDQSVEPQKLSFMVSRDSKEYSSLEEFDHSYKIKHVTFIWFNHHDLSVTYTIRLKNYLCRYLKKLTHNCQILEATKLFFYRGVDRLWYSYRSGVYSLVLQMEKVSAIKGTENTSMYITKWKKPFWGDYVQ